MTELEAAWASWNRAPGDSGTAARLETACGAVDGLTATEVRESLAAQAREALGHEIAVVLLPPAKPPRPEGRKERPRLARAVSVAVSGPISWSWYWPASDTDHLLKRASWAVKRLTRKDAPLGVYRVTVNGESREVVRSEREE